VVELLIQGPPYVRTQTCRQNARQHRIPGPTLYRGQRIAGPRGAIRGAGRRRIIGRAPRHARAFRLPVAWGGMGGRSAGISAGAASTRRRPRSSPHAVAQRLDVSAGRPGYVRIEDSSGIDLTRLDNAHTIFVIIDDREPDEPLRPWYDPELHAGSVDPVAGSVQRPAQSGPRFRQLPQHRGAEFHSDGQHPSAGGGLVLDQVFNYPNPFPRETFLHARVNQPARLKIQILTVAGRRVWETQVDGKAGENYIPWNGRDSVGEKVAIGVYLFKVTAESPSGAKASSIGRALLTQ
jgi:hypothetical protein